jgi:hypothetical protein
MAKRVKIAFDLDGIFVDKPPFIPKRLIELLFKGHVGEGLYYRFPSLGLEQLIRKVSHFYLFRPPIKNNIDFLKGLAQGGKYELFIVSARYSFLEKVTWFWLKRRGLAGFFKKVYLNLGNRQPHLYKKEVLEKLKPDIFIDDDPQLALFLGQNLKKTKVYCLSAKKYPGKLKLICSLGEIFK